jgi:hypothetical protein
MFRSAHIERKGWLRKRRGAASHLSGIGCPLTDRAGSSKQRLSRQEVQGMKDS